MSLPDNFSSWEHLQDTWRRVHNRRVREHFSDLADPDADWEANINSPRASLRVACTMLDTDTAAMTNMRIQLFWIVLGQAQALQTPMYGIPIPGYQESRKFHPQIQLYFQEDPRQVDDGYAPVTGEISFRLMNETLESITEAKALQYANRVKRIFATGAAFTWHKGKNMCYYADKPKGYQLQLLCFSENEGRRLVEAILDVQGHSPIWANFTTSTTLDASSAYPSVPPSQRIYGQMRRVPRRRPTATVRFRYAALHIWSLPKPVILVDRSGYWNNALVA